MHSNKKLIKNFIKISAVILLAVLFSDQVIFAAAPKNKLQASQNISVDSAVKKDTINANINPSALPIDTSASVRKQEIITTIDTAKKIDSVLTAPEGENTMTNTKLFTYILLTLLGLGLFFFIFVINLFKTFHKKKSTRQSLLLSWSLFLIVTIIWIFIVWGLIAGFWTSASFMVVVIFLFIISLIMTIIAVKSK